MLFEGHIPSLNEGRLWPLPRLIHRSHGAGAQDGPGGPATGTDETPA